MAGEIVGQPMSGYNDADSIVDATKKAYYKTHSKITTFGKLDDSDANFTNYNMSMGNIAEAIADGTTITVSGGKLSASVTSPVTDVQVGGTSVVSSGVAAIPAIPNAASLADGNTITASNGKLSANVPVTDVTADGSSVVSGGVAVIPKQVNADWNADGSSSVAKILNKPDLSVYAVANTLATVATTGAYTDLSGTPTLATVATSGSYNDLTDQPTIPEPQVNADWDSSSGVAKILNKPNLSIYAETSSLAPVATSGSYEDLEDKPTIPSIPPFPEDAGSIDYVLGIKDNKLAWVELDASSSS